jgi:Stress-induced bacterial acidophilic repeat motif.
MNEKNLVPFSERSKSEARELGAKGGRASGASRRRRKTMEQCAKFILSLPANSKEDWETLIAAGVSLDNTDPDDIDNLTVVNAAIIKAAKSGDVAAFKALRDVIRDDEHLKIEKERLKLEKKKLERKDDNSDVFDKLDDVLSKIGE